GARMHCCRLANSLRTMGERVWSLPNWIALPREVLPMLSPTTWTYLSNLSAQERRLRAWRNLIHAVLWLRSSRKTDEEVVHGHRSRGTVPSANILAEPVQA